MSCIWYLICLIPNTTATYIVTSDHFYLLKWLMVSICIYIVIVIVPVYVSMLYRCWYLAQLKWCSLWSTLVFSWGWYFYWKGIGCKNQSCKYLYLDNFNHSIDLSLLPFFVSVGTLVWCWKKNWKIKHQVIILWSNVVWIEKIKCGGPT